MQVRFTIQYMTRVLPAAGSPNLVEDRMPFKSKAQRRKFAELLVKGEISEETFEEWNRSTGGADLPERLHPAPRRKAKKGGAATRSSKTAKRPTRSGAKKSARTKARAKGGGAKGH